LLFFRLSAAVKFLIEKLHLIFLRTLHCSTLGQIKHSSVLPDGGISNPLKCAHLAGESKTIGYSVAVRSRFFL